MLRFPTTVRACALVAVGFLLLLVPASIRHYFVWGGDFAGALNVFEWLCLLIAAGGVGRMLWQAGWRLAPGELRAAQVLRGGFWICLASVVVLPMLSEDLFSYVVRGRVLAVHGANPYTTLASEFASVDPSVAWAKQWADFPLPYGPGIALYQGAIAWLADLPSFLPWEARFWLGVFLFKLVHALLLFACAVLLAQMMRERDETQRARAVLLVLWNPFVLFEVGVNGHNDVLLVFPLLLACRAAQLERHGASAFWLLFSVQLKFVSAVLFPIFAALALRRQRHGEFAVGTGLGLALFGGLGLIFWREPDALSFLSRQTSLYPTPLNDLLVGITGNASVVKGIGLALTAAVVFYGAARVEQWEDLSLRSIHVFWVLVAIGLPAAFAWYHVWWIPLAVLCASPVPRRVLVAVMVLGPLAYTPVLLTREWTSFGIGFQWAMSMVVPFAVLLIRRILPPRSVGDRRRIPDDDVTEP